MQPELEILIATTERTDTGFLSSVFPGGLEEASVLIVNQSVDDKRIPESMDDDRLRIINLEGKGLSRSRNTALKNAKGDILYLADDDVEFLPGFSDSIKKVHKTFPDDIIIFPMTDEKGRFFGKHRSRPYRMRRVDKIFSPQISFKRSFIDRNGIRFDERFGLGAGFPDAENYVLLKTLKRKGIFPLYAGGSPVVMHRGETSSYFLERDDNIRARLAVIRMFYGPLVYPYFFKLMFFLWRKGKISFRHIPSKWRLLRESRI